MNATDYFEYKGLPLIIGYYYFNPFVDTYPGAEPDFYIKSVKLEGHDITFLFEQEASMSELESAYKTRVKALKEADV